MINPCVYLCTFAISAIISQNITIPATEMSIEFRASLTIVSVICLLPPICLLQNQNLTWNGNADHTHTRAAHTRCLVFGDKRRDNQISSVYLCFDSESRCCDLLLWQVKRANVVQSFHLCVERRRRRPRRRRQRSNRNEKYNKISGVNIDFMTCVLLVWPERPSNRLNEINCGFDGIQRVFTAVSTTSNLIVDLYLAIAR